MIPIRDIERWHESAHYRKKSDWVCIDQPKVIKEWLPKHALGQLLCAEGRELPDWTSGYECVQVSYDWLVGVTKKPSHPGVMAVFERPAYNVSNLMRCQSALVLDGIQDPGNMGTIVRSMVAFGCQSLCLTSDCVDPFHPKAVGASSGAIGHIQGIYYEHHWKEWLSSTAMPVYVLDPLACHSIWDVAPKPYVLVCGSEGRGIQSSLISSVSITPLSIPTSDHVESLNAAMSVSIALNKLSRGMHK
jgi:TrmH family RNA methyltransferase